MLHRLKIWTLHRLFLVTRPMTLGVRIFLQDEAGRVLLVKHTYVPGWHLPGGGVEAGSTLHETAVRELFEETGIKAQSEPELVSVYANQKASRRDHVVLFRVDRWQQEQAFNSGLEIKQVGFFSPEDLPEDTAASTLARIQEILRGKSPDNYW